MAFHPYPQVIPSVFNPSGFGPPRGLTPASACPWIDHPASRPRSATQRHLKGSLSLRLACKLNLAAQRDSLAHSTKGTPSHRKRVLRLLVGARFQVLFHSPLGVLFTFPSRYWFAIGHRRVFSLGGWSPQLRTGFHVPGPTRVASCGAPGIGVRGSHPLRPAFPCRSASLRLCDRMRGLGPPRRCSHDPGVATPPGLNAHTGLGSPAFARRYSRVLG